MADPTDQIVVLRTHLEETQDVLNSLRGYLVAKDLAEAFRQLKPTNRPSRLTVQVDKALQHIAGYLEGAE